MPIKAALATLAINKVFNLTQKGYESIRKLIQDKASEKKYGFVPNKDENNFLIRVAEKSYFREFGNLLPKHRYSDLIRVGYLLSHLNKVGGEINRSRVNEIRELIFKRPNGSYLIKIVNLVTTGAIVPVVDHLNDLKKKNYDTDFITGVFDEIIREWEKYAYFVKAETKEKEIIPVILNKMQNKLRIIMIFSYGSAKIPATKAVAQILNGNKNEGYFYESNNSIEGEKEVHYSTFSLMEQLTY